ncbi:aminoacyl-tRNA hydrolase [Acidihalobacter aeolianus]|uniref:Peptidyl-tRNA hydrolase n=1 Tax=Acidihalobacter aeolianus TaxID=2792603 RepID=A0A1D8KAQ1_9GAMM|nr:aminoacyl-tRNA hydrolase [Acidihalobacter aeolianus]AOV18006.1 aminoacyl-tRNA hydrolase [Acidihalobacter aeolianus]
MSEPLSLIVGLGNPGEKYDQTRHNAGFWFVDEVLRRHGGSLRAESRFSGEVGRTSIDGQDIWLLKPTTFMNRSGQSVAALAAFYKIPLQRILVAHDEIDLSVGDARFKFSGGHGGHNGLRDIFSHLGRDFWRARIGVGHPGHRDQVIDYVLGRPGKDEAERIARAIDVAVDTLPPLAAGLGERAMQALHSR